jgi:hypothetical protein
MRNVIRLCIASSVVACVAAPAAAVQSVTLTSVGIYSPGHVDVTTAGVTKSEYAVPLTITATSRGIPFDALGFCIDLAHNIYVGLGSQLATSLAYHVAPLTTDSFGNPLSAKQVREIGGLATLGFGIAKGSATDKPAQLAAIQQAIWTIEYPASTFVATGDYVPAQATYAAQFVSEAPRLRGFARTIVADNGATQGFITNIGGVPEPAMWVEMIAGLGLVGAISRRRRTLDSVAA